MILLDLCALIIGAILGYILHLIMHFIRFKKATKQTNNKDIKNVEQSSMDTGGH